jgi:hypothetical protein
MMLNAPTISELVPGNLKPINIPIPIPRTIRETTTIPLKNLAKR